MRCLHLQTTCLSPQKEGSKGFLAYSAVRGALNTLQCVPLEPELMSLQVLFIVQILKPFLTHKLLVPVALNRERPGFYVYYWFWADQN